MSVRAAGLGRSFMLTNPGRETITWGMALTAMDAVEMSPDNPGMASLI
ncbi:hypothetical protein LCGC14_1900010, partial [marine sediment metagenome]